MKKRKYICTTKLWLYPGEKASWHLLTIPKKESEAIKKSYGLIQRGWGSLPVTVTIKKIVWQTSIFPDSKSGTYVLPVKAQVRNEAGIEAGDSVHFVLTLP